MAGRGERHRDQAQHVGKHDEHEKRHDVREVLQAIATSDILNHLVDEAIGKLGHGLTAAGHHGASARAHNQQQGHRRHGDRHPECHVRGRVPADRAVPEQGLHDELIHGLDAQTAACVSCHVLLPFIALPGVGRIHLDRLGRAQHHADPRGKPGENEKDQEERHRAKQAVQPIPYPEPDQKTGQKLGHHSPGNLCARIFVGSTRLGSILALRGRDPRLQRLQAVGIRFLGHEDKPPWQSRRTYEGTAPKSRRCNCRISQCKIYLK